MKHETKPLTDLLQYSIDGCRNEPFERLTLVNKLVEIHGLKRTTAQMQIARLIKRGVLIADGTIVQIARVTQSRSHTVTGGGGV